MGEPRPEKVAVVTEVRDKLRDSDAALLTEYRGIDVPGMADLRRSLREVGGEYKIYKNTLVRFAVQELGLEIEDLLIGPTAIAFVGERSDGTPGDAAAVAKALRDFAKTNDALVLKGGVLDDNVLTADDLRALAELPSRDVLLAQLAGAFQAPLTKLAGLLQAIPRDFAYGLQALIDKQGGAPPTEDEVERDEAPNAGDVTAESSSDESAEDVQEQAAEASSTEATADTEDNEDTEETEETEETAASAAEHTDDSGAEQATDEEEA